MNRTTTNIVANIICGILSLALIVATVLLVVFVKGLAGHGSAVATGLLSLIFAAMVYFGVRGGPQEKQ